MTLAEYPYVVVRFSCTMCRRQGQARLARLAEKYGADLPLFDLLNYVAWTCPLPRPGSGNAKPQKYGAKCGVHFPDLAPGAPPPDLPPRRLRLVHSRDAAE